MEAHEGIGELVIGGVLDLLLVHVLGHGVVDVQERGRSARDAAEDVLRNRAVDVHLAGNGDTAARQAAVDVAGHKAELRLEGRPALVGKDIILGRALVGLGPVEQGDLVLRELGQDAGVGVVRAELLGHVGRDFCDARIVRVVVKGREQVQLGVLLDVDAQVEQGLDGRVAGDEVVGARAEGEDLEVAQADADRRDRDELADHRGDLVRRAHGVLGDVDVLEGLQADGVAGVEHAAVRVAAAVDQVVAGLLSRRDEHRRAAELVGQHGLRALGAEVAQEHDQRVAAVRLDLLQRLHGVGFGFNDGGNIDDLAARLGVGVHDRRLALCRELDGETVAAGGNQAELDNRKVIVHGNTPP